MSRPAPARVDAPTRTQVGPNERLVQITGRLDSMGRMMFSAYWSCDTPFGEGGPPNGVRGQVFHTRLVEFITDHERRRLSVRVWAISDEAAAGPLAELVHRVDTWRKTRTDLATPTTTGRDQWGAAWQHSDDEAAAIAHQATALLEAAKKAMAPPPTRR